MIWNRSDTYEKVSKKLKEVKAKCPKCKKIDDIAFETGKDYRQTYCSGCGEVVIWEKVK